MKSSVVAKRVLLKSGDISLLVLISFLWAICFPLIEIGRSGAPPLLFGALRALIAGVGILVPVFFFTCRAPQGVTVWVYIILTGLTYTFLGFGGMFLSGGRVTPGLATVIANTQPLIAAILAHFFLSEGLDLRRITGLFIGFLGIIFIATPASKEAVSFGNAAGVFLILLGAVGTALGNVFLKKLAGRVEAALATGIQFLVGSAILFAASLASEAAATVHWDTAFLLSLFILGLPGTALVTFLWYRLLQRVPLTQLNVFTFLTPIFGLLIGFLFFSERLTLYEIGGTGLALGGIFFVIKR